MKMFSVLASLLFALALTAPVSAGPTTFCDDHGGSHECWIYETDIDGEPSEIGQLFTLPNEVAAGYVVLLEDGSGPFDDRSNWSDVLVFGISGDVLTGTTRLMQLLSDGCESGVEGDVSCFPSLSIVTSSNWISIAEALVEPTTYVAGANTYHIFSDPPEAIPEPSTLILMGSALLGLIGSRRRPQA